MNSERECVKEIFDTSGSDPFDEIDNDVSGDCFGALINILDDVPMIDTDYGAELQSPPDDLAGLSSIFGINKDDNDSAQLLPALTNSKPILGSARDTSGKIISVQDESSCCEDSCLLQTSPVSECNSASNIELAVPFRTVIPLKRSRTKRPHPSDRTSNTRILLGNESSHRNLSNLLKTSGSNTVLESSYNSAEEAMPCGFDIVVAVKDSHSKHTQSLTPKPVRNITKDDSCSVSKDSTCRKSLRPSTSTNSLPVLESSGAYLIPAFGLHSYIAVKRARSKRHFLSTCIAAKCPRGEPSCSSTDTTLLYSRNKHSQSLNTIPVRRCPRTKRRHCSSSGLCLVFPRVSSTSSFPRLHPVAVSASLETYSSKMNLNPTERKPGASLLPNVIETKMSLQWASTTRKCMHCGATKTSLWRKGPMGPMSLCNACYCQKRKAGSLSSEYCPKASQYRVALLQSKSHKKTKEMTCKAGIEDAATASSACVASMHFNSSKKIRRSKDKSINVGSGTKSTHFLESLVENSLKKVVAMRNGAAQEAAVVTSPSFITSLHSDTVKNVAKLGEEFAAQCPVRVASPHSSCHEKNSLQLSAGTHKGSNYEATKKLKSGEVPKDLHSLCNACPKEHDATGNDPFSCLSSSEKIVGIRKKAEMPLKQANGNRKCTQCETTRTPKWRRGPKGLRTLCNACGVRYQRSLWQLRN